MKAAGGTSLRKVDAVGLAVLLGMTVAAYLVGFGPLVERRQRRSDQRRAYLAECDKARRFRQAQAGLQGQLELAREQLDASPLQLTGAEQTNRRILALGELARRHGLEVETVQPGRAVTSRWYDLMPMSFDARGSYTQAAAFLHAMRQELPDMGVRGLEIVRGDGGKSPGMIHLALVWFNTPASPGARVASAGP